MTNLTPTQEEALNRAIAEFKGYINIIQSDDGKLIGTDTERYAVTATIRENIPNYTRSLDAIVTVVQRWCKDNVGHVSLVYDMYNKLYRATINYRRNCWTFRECVNDNPALALCLAFAQAAKIEWEGK